MTTDLVFGKNSSTLERSCDFSHTQSEEGRERKSAWFEWLEIDSESRRRMMISRGELEQTKKP